MNNDTIAQAIKREGLLLYTCILLLLLLQALYAWTKVKYATIKKDMDDDSELH